MNIRELLVDLSKSNSKSSYKSIATIILSNYNKGIFKNQIELAKECFVSESVLTKFSKKLGFTGFREFNFSLKSEHERYYNSKKNISENYEANKTIFDYFHSLILKNNDFSQALIEKVIKTKKIVILASYQLIPCAKYANDIFSEIGIEVLFSEIRIIADKIVKKNIDKTPVLLLLAGQDNSFLVEFLNFLNTDYKKENLFIISSESQSNKVNHYNNKFVIYNKNEKYINFKYRKICIDYILLNLQTMIV